MIPKIRNNLIRQTSKQLFCLKIDHGKFLQKDSKLRQFYKKLNTESPEQTFKKDLSSEQIDYVELIYKSFFKNMNSEDNQLFILRKNLNALQGEDKGFIESKITYIYI